MKERWSSVLARWLGGAFLAFCAFLTGHFILALLALLFENPARFGWVGLITLAISGGVFYFLSLIVYRTFSRRYRESGRGLLPPRVMLGLLFTLLAIITIRSVMSALEGNVLGVVGAALAINALYLIIRSYRARETPASASGDPPSEDRALDHKTQDMAKLERKSTEVVASLERASLLPKSVVVSPDSRRIAYVNQRGSIFNRSFHVSVNSNPDRGYKKLLPDSLCFSPDSRRLAYVTKSRSGFSVVVDSQERRHYDRVFPETLRFSPNGARLAYLAKDKRGFFWVVDETEGMAHELTPGNLVFSPDGTDTAYAADSGGRSVLVRNDTVAGDHDNARRPIFSPDGRRFAYCAQEGQETFVVLDGEHLNKYEGLDIYSIKFSPDSQRFAYVAVAAGKHLVVIDNTEIGPYDFVYPGPACPVFSPDSKRLAYCAGQSGRLRVWVDDESFGEIDDLIMWSHAAKGKESESVFRFNSDGTQILYFAKLGEGFTVFLNGEEINSTFSTLTHPFVFSPNDQRWACAGVAENQTQVVLDGIGYRPDHRILGRAVFFSPDSAHLAYMAARGAEQFVVVDDIEGEKFGPLRFDEGDILFDSPSELHYLIMKGWDVYLIHDEIVS